VKNGKVHGKTVRRHTSADFIGFLADIVERSPTGKEIHIVLDNLSAHKTAAVKDFLDNHPHVQFHFTPRIRRG
jgi:transposase